MDVDLKSLRTTTSIRVSCILHIRQRSSSYRLYQGGVLRYGSRVERAGYHSTPPLGILSGRFDCAAGMIRATTHRGEGMPRCRILTTQLLLALMFRA